MKRSLNNHTHTLSKSKSIDQNYNKCAQFWTVLIFKKMNEIGGTLFELIFVTSSGLLFYSKYDKLEDQIVKQ